jgi:hypothetical protein
MDSGTQFTNGHLLCELIDSEQSGRLALHYIV